MSMIRRTGRWNTGEERILELKREINELCRTFKQPPRYL